MTECRLAKSRTLLGYARWLAESRCCRCSGSSRSTEGVLLLGRCCTRALVLHVEAVGMLVFAVHNILDGSIDIGENSLDSFIGLGCYLGLELYLQCVSFDQYALNLRNLPTLADYPWLQPDNV